ncbi:unconventional prefoldin RPB5 interactor 1 [Notechis scutatus]|uniref:Unconventional prefoldin RPB5 interactor 1 n=1 Tax=Notechis scutatus TaxID=8663 RepID=A0A6J1ULH2_9SAUR|nr:unconventional prefoldin RPB5 interactor 1 [Notechis scutatus]
MGYSLESLNPNSCFALTFLTQASNPVPCQELGYCGQAIEHKGVRKMLDDLGKVMKNFESRAEFTEDLQKISGAAGDVVDIREITESGELEMKGKHRTAHKPHSKPKICAFEGNVDESRTDKKPNGDLKSEEDVWARLDELERQEQILGELSRISETSNAKAEAASSSEEEREDKKLNLDILQKDEKPNTQGNFQKDVTDFESFRSQVNGPNHYSSDDEDDFAISENAVPTIYFSHTVEPKRVRINTGKNTTLKFSEKKEEAKRKRKNSNGNGHGTTELPNIKTPADIYRVFVDVVNGEYVPRKSILKSRSRENSVCSDTSESSNAEFDDRRGILRSLSYEDATHSDNSEGILEEEEEEEQREQNSLSRKAPPLSGMYEAFSGTVVEKEPLSPSTIPHPVLAHPVLPTILERKSEEILCEASEDTTKRVSKFKAARMQQKS